MEKNLDIYEKIGPLLDTIKDFCYLFLGVAIGWLFWRLCEHYFKSGLRYVNPVFFLGMVIWGASGFFFLNPLFNLLLCGLRLLPNSLDFIYNFFDSLLQPICQLFCTAVPDLDITLYLWADSIVPNLEWEFLKHRSWIFSSVIIPFILMFASLLSTVFLKHISATITRIIMLLYSSAIGLFLGIFGHLLGDIILEIIPSKDVSIKIYGWGEPQSLAWLEFNIFLGIFIPLLMIILTGLFCRRKANLPINLRGQ